MLRIPLSATRLAGLGALALGAAQAAGQGSSRGRVYEPPEDAPREEIRGRTDRAVFMFEK